LLGGETGAAFPEHLALAVRLAADRVVPQEEPQGKDPAPGELGFVAAGGDEVEAAGLLLPAAHLQAVEHRARLVELKDLPRVVSLAEPVVDGQEVEDGEVDRVVAEAVDLLDP